RLRLSKGDKPVTARDLQIKLVALWKTSSPWKMISLGRGFYEFKFTSYEDMRLAWSSGTVNLKPGVLRLSKWTNDFNSSAQSQTNVQVWIRLMELPQEYWRQRTLFEIASAIGIPLALDEATKNRTIGHYARLLVDLDLSNRIFDE
ncbi:putative NBS resistance protein, partial [Trifolium pratense]